MRALKIFATAAALVSCSSNESQSNSVADISEESSDAKSHRFDLLKRGNAERARLRALRDKENQLARDDAQRQSDELEESIQKLLLPIPQNTISSVLNHPEKLLHNDITMNPSFTVCRAGSEDGKKTIVLQIEGNGELYVVYNLAGKIQINRGSPDQVVREVDNPFIGNTGVGFKVGDRLFRNFTLDKIQWIEDTAYIPIVVSQDIKPSIIKTTLTKLGSCEPLASRSE